MMDNFIKNKFNQLFYLSILVSIFPIWLLKGSTKNGLFFLVFLIIFLIYLIIHLVILSTKKLDLSINSKLIILSLFFTYGLDLNLRLNTVVKFFFLEILNINNQNIFFYIFSFIFLSFISFIIFKIIKTNQKNILIIFSIILVLSIFNFFNLFKNIYFFNSSYETNIKFIKDKSDYKIYNSEKEKTVVIFFDNLTGFGGIDDKIKYGVEAKNSYKELFEKYDFEFYENAYSMYFITDYSVPSTLNFNYKANQIDEIKNYRSKSKNEFSKWKLKENKLFKNQNFNKIYTNSNQNIDFCDKKLVDLCERFFPNRTHKFLENLSFNKADHFFYLLLKSDSLVNKFFWRIFLETDVFANYDIWTYTKANFPYRIKKFGSNISKTNYDLYFAHFLTPHSPFGYSLKKRKCAFDVSLLSIEKKFSLEKQQSKHYEEIVCLNLFLGKFFENLKDLKSFDNLRIILVSDTGSLYGNDSGKRTINKKNTFPALFAVKKPKKSIQKKIIDKKQFISTQFLFSYYLNKDHNKRDKDENIVFDSYNNKYIVYK